MNPNPNAASESHLDSAGIAPAVVSPTRPTYWSIRRELWEYRSIYIAPLAAAVVYMLGYSISLFWVPRSVRGMAAEVGAPFHYQVERG